jgi:hypothetical protein
MVEGEETMGVELVTMFALRGEEVAPLDDLRAFLADFRPVPGLFVGMLFGCEKGFPNGGLSFTLLELPGLDEDEALFMLALF